MENWWKGTLWWKLNFRQLATGNPRTIHGSLVRWENRLKGMFHYHATRWYLKMKSGWWV